RSLRAGVIGRGHGTRSSTRLVPLLQENAAAGKACARPPVYFSPARPAAEDPRKRALPAPPPRARRPPRRKAIADLTPRVRGARVGRPDCAVCAPATFPPGSRGAA